MSNYLERKRKRRENAPQKKRKLVCKIKIVNDEEMMIYKLLVY